MDIPIRAQLSALFQNTSIEASYTMVNTHLFDLNIPDNVASGT
jgi:hypothetical protein